jgi:rSAM/selenodomain-associated transferase 1
MSSENDRLLLVMAKEPRAGSVKTRLASAVGAERAAEIALAFLEDTLLHAAQAAREAGASLGLLHDPADEKTHAAMKARAETLGVALSLGPQLEHPSLGARLEKAFRRSLEDWKRVVVIGTDSPDLEPGDYVSAFAALGRSRAVLGPAEDGGYWLVGIEGREREPERVFLDEIAWSTGTALADTRKAFERRRISVSLLETREDVDQLPTLLSLTERLRRDPSRAPRTAAVLGVRGG